MPIPLVVAGVVLLGGGGAGSWLTIRKLRKPVKIVLLGESKSGKTTLLLTWQGKWTSQPTRTAPGGEFIGKIEVSTGKKQLWIEKKFVFRNLTDFSGWDEAMRASKKEVEAAKVVLYFLKATHLEEEENRHPDKGHGPGWERIMMDACRLEKKMGDIDKLIMVVTYTDEDSRHSRLSPPEYHAKVAGQLRDVINAAGITDDDKYGVVVGSLKTAESSAILASDVVVEMT